MKERLREIEEKMREQKLSKGVSGAVLRQTADGDSLEFVRYGHPAHCVDCVMLELQDVEKNLIASVTAIVVGVPISIDIYPFMTPKRLLYDQVVRKFLVKTRSHIPHFKSVNFQFL